jgi:hypothetical protein
MSLDPVANFVNLVLSTGYGSTDTTIVVASGASLLPTSASFNMTWWNSTDYPDPSQDPNVEIVRVNGPEISGNTLLITRAQEGTVASPKNIPGKTYRLILGITAKSYNDMEANLQRPWRYVNVNGTIDGSNTTFTLAGSITPFDANSVQITLARQPQIQGIDYTISGSTITYITPPPAGLSGQPHVAQYQ